MSEKIYVRKCESYTLWEATKPIEVDVEKLRKCEPPYEGNTPEELLNYLGDNVWCNEEFYENETNKEVYGEDEIYDLGMEESYTEHEFFDSRNKGCDESIQVGVPNKEWTKTGGFQPLAYGENEY